MNYPFTATPLFIGEDTSGVKSDTGICVTRQKWAQLTNHDGGEALRGVVGALRPAVFRSAAQREVGQVLRKEREHFTEGLPLYLSVQFEDGLDIEPTTYSHCG